MSLKNNYLILYSLVQLIGTLSVVISIVRYNVDHWKGYGWNELPIPGSYSMGEPMMKVVMILQFLEIVHCLTGLTRGSPIAPIVQVGFKAFIFHVLMITEPRVHGNRSTGALLFIWCLADALRYPFYLMQLMDKSIHILTWIRYSAWIILYPLGISLEAVVTYQNFDYLIQSGRLSFPLPNRLNVSFHIVTFLKAYLYFGIFLGSYTMLRYMWNQRKKVLSKSP